jgi:hypothetical protein
MVDPFIGDGGSRAVQLRTYGLGAAAGRPAGRA